MLVWCISYPQSVADWRDVEGIVVAVAGEELVYRLAAVLLIGAVCARLAGRNWRDTAEWGTGPAIGGLVGAGLVFSALPGHVDQMTGAANVVPFLSLAVLLGYVALRSGSLLPGFLVHVTIDLAALAFFAGELPGGLRVLVDVGALARRGARSHARRSPPRPPPAGPARHRPAQQRARGHARRELIQATVGPRVLLVTPPGPDLHDTGRGHPERPARIGAVLAGVEDAQLDDALTTSPGRDATRAELQLVHDARYLDALEEFARAGGGHLDPDTVVAPGSYAAAARACGCGLEAVDALARDEADAAFVVVRPPGHHATSARGPGLLPVQQRRRRRGRAGRARGTCRRRRLGRAPRQRHPGRLLGRSERSLRVDAPIPRVSRHRAGRRDGRRTGAGPHAELPVATRRDRRCGARRHRPGGGARRRSLRARLGPRLGGVRRPPRRSAGRTRLERGRLRPPRHPRARARAGAGPDGRVPRGRLRPRRAPGVERGDRGDPRRRARTRPRRRRVAVPGAP